MKKSILFFPKRISIFLFFVLIFLNFNLQAQAVDDHIQVLTCYNADTLDVLVNDLPTLPCTRAQITLLTITQPSKVGAVAFIDANKDIVYTRVPNFIGCDTLEYEVVCNSIPYTAHVYITVIPCPDNIDTANCTGHPPATTWGIDHDYLRSSTLVNSYGQPYVGDVDGCGKNEVVIWNYIGNRGQSDAVLIFDDSLNLKYTINAGGTSGQATGPPDLALAFAKTSPSNTAADIFMTVGGSTGTNSVIKCFELVSGAWMQKWTTTAGAAGVSYAACINIGDINNDGELMLYADFKIFNAKTGALLLTLPDTPNPKGKRDGSRPIMNLLADMDNDGTLEAVGGTCVYKLHITNLANSTGNYYTTLYQLPATAYTNFAPDGFTSVADINLDGYLDVIVSTAQLSPSHPAILVWNTQTTPPSLIGTPVIVPGSGNIASRVFVGDVDNDGYPELAVVSNNRLSCFGLNTSKTDFVPRWAPRTISDGSAETYMCMFDFNQDEKQELVYRDERWLHIIDGETGADKATIACFSPTTWEGAIVADLNGDGHAQIIVTGNSISSSTEDQTYLRVYTSSSPGAWAPARSVWNQYSYNAVNINEDLTVPRYQMNPSKVFPNGKRPYNSFLKQQTLLNKEGDPLWTLANIVWVTEPTVIFAGDSVVVTGRIANIGDAALQPPVYITFYKNSIASANIHQLDSIPTTIFAKDSLTFSFTLKNKKTLAPSSEIWISINDFNNVYPYQEQCDTNGRRKIEVIIPISCPDAVSDFEGNIYSVIPLAGLCWTSNIKSKIYSDDETPVPFAAPYYSDEYPDIVANDSIFGLLYTWYSAVHTEPDQILSSPPIQGVCPNGWRLPSHAELKNLDLFPAKDLMSEKYWLDPGTNATGFDARPAGMYNSTSSKFMDLYGFTGYWAYDAPLDQFAQNFSLTYYCNAILNFNNSKYDGLSVRCVKEGE